MGGADVRSGESAARVHEGNILQFMIDPNEFCMIRVRCPRLPFLWTSARPAWLDLLCFSLNGINGIVPEVPVDMRSDLSRIVFFRGVSGIWPSSRRSPGPDPQTAEAFIAFKDGGVTQACCRSV